ncbi:TolC family outer membrane protein [Paraburkholderia dinghuensis]|uniref:Type I secretion protein TolC n=1 Tax=Paraburkholderia dinghuensis TaxID=2305225 RepID=A0A3N6N0P3_9BURK|nr:TolC family outer membrane protein [Paraburkholderia dinghuensis]RQH07955.1 type I secretion protein TolC [Paraburkholderia dinghuensis]
MKGRFALTALACAFACAMQAGGARAADLLDVVEDTLDHDATLAAARDAYRAAAQAKPKARAGLLPRVDGGWGRQYNRIAMDGFPNVDYWQNGWTVVLTQPIFDWARWSTWRQADYVVARGELESASAGQDAILRAAQAYFDALAATDEVARADDYLHALDAHLALLARAKAAGEATLVDLREAEASRAQAQLQLLDARDRTLLARAALERLTGKPAETLATLPDHAVMPALEPADADSWITQAQAHGYPVQIRELALQIAKLDTEKARASHYPRVDLQITHTPAGAGGGYSRPTTTTTGLLALQIPLFSGGEATAQVDEAKALEDKARNELEAATRGAAGAARDGWLRTTSGRARIVAMETLVQRAQASLDATMIGFRTGSRASTDVLRATDSLYGSRRDLIRARYDTVLALLRLLADTASLNLDEVGRINTQLYAQRVSDRRTVDPGVAVAVRQVAESSPPDAASSVVADKNMAVQIASPVALLSGSGSQTAASFPAMARGTVSIDSVRGKPSEGLARLVAVHAGPAAVPVSDSTPLPAPMATTVLTPVPESENPLAPAPDVERMRESTPQPQFVAANPSVSAPVVTRMPERALQPVLSSTARRPINAAEMAPAIPAVFPTMGTPLR